mmetsp:Transcript_88914/g.269638  ORF Transcript_88914/g.269638 Transcript_88914/m.269638 type:complete len:243 (-) Transcript_88914:81-809(-)
MPVGRKREPFPCGHIRVHVPCHAICLSLGFVGAACRASASSASLAQPVVDDTGVSDMCDDINSGKPECEYEDASFENMLLLQTRLHVTASKLGSVQEKQLSQTGAGRHAVGPNLSHAHRRPLQQKLAIPQVGTTESTSLADLWQSPDAPVVPLLAVAAEPARLPSGAGPQQTLIVGEPAIFARWTAFWVWIWNVLREAHRTAKGLLVFLVAGVVSLWTFLICSGTFFCIFRKVDMGGRPEDT